MLRCDIKSTLKWVSDSPCPFIFGFKQLTTLKKNALNCSETLIIIYQSIQRRITEG